MKTIFCTTLLTAITLAFSSTAFAAHPFNEIYAIVAAKSLSELADPPPAPNVKAKRTATVVMPSTTEVQITFLKDNSVFTFDYREFQVGRLFLNDRPIKIGAKRSEAELKIDVENIVGKPAEKQKKSAAFTRVLLPVANAGALLPNVAATEVLLKHVYQANRAANLLASETKISLTDSLIATYRNDAQFWENQAIQRNTSRSFTSLNFSCANGKLISVGEADFVNRGRPGTDTGLETQLTLKKDGNYTYSAVFCQPPKTAVIDRRGKVLSTNPSCPEVGASIYTRRPLFQFPLVAAQCCAEAGCYEKVSAEIRRLSGEMIKESPNFKPVERRPNPHPGVTGFE